MTLRVPRQPYCPRCGYALTQQTTAIHGDVAWCINCYNVPVEHLSWLDIALHFINLNDTWTGDRGVRFWTPSKPYKEGIVELFLIRRREARQPKALTDDEVKWLQAADAAHDRRSSAH